VKMKQGFITKTAAAAFAVISLLLIGSVFFANQAIQQERTAVSRQATFKQLAINLANASDYLTNECRAYVQFGDKQYLDNYWNEILVTKTRDNVLSQLSAMGAPSAAFDQVALAKKNSDALVGTETRAMRLVLEATHVPQANWPAAEVSWTMTAADEALNDAAKMVTARQIMFDAKYASDKSIIMGPIAQFQAIINAQATQQVADAQSHTGLALTLLVVLAFLVPLGIFTVLWIFHSQVGVPISRYSRALDQRDPAQRSFALVPAGTEELRSLADAFNQQLETEKQNEQTAETAQRLAKVIDAVAHGAQEQAQGIDVITSMANQISGAIQQVVVNAQAGATTSAQATRTAQEGSAKANSSIARMSIIKEKVGHSVTRVKEMGQRSAEIGQIVQTIETIADQTNLLALNAAIEAARAGENGKGFAVVADEVRKLAERASSSTKEIGTLIQGIQATMAETVQAMDESANEVEMGVSHVNESGQALASILQAAAAVNEQVASIAAAAEEMDASSDELVSAIERVSAVITENSAASEEMAAVASEMTHAATGLAQFDQQQKTPLSRMRAA
jgi:methyl-accepting chemotaxis protein